MCATNQRLFTGMSSKGLEAILDHVGPGTRAADHVEGGEQLVHFSGAE